MQPFPEPDDEGNVPALEYVRASIARNIVRERKALGLTQEQLAKLSGVRQETICRLETGLHSPTAQTGAKGPKGAKGDILLFDAKLGAFGFRRFCYSAFVTRNS